MNINSKLKRYIRIFLFLSAVGVISGSLCNIPEQPKSFVSLFLIIGFLFSYLSANDIRRIACNLLKPDNKAFYLRINFKTILPLFLLVMSILIAALSGFAIKIAFLGLAIYILGCLSDKESIARDEIPAMLLTVMLYTIYIVLDNYVPQFKYGVEEMSLAVSEWSSAIISRKVALGPTYSGLPLLFLFIFYLLSTTAFVKGRIKILSSILTLISLIASNVIFIIVWYFTANSQAITKLDIFRPLVEQFDYRPLLFIFFIASLFIFMPLYQYKEPDTCLPARKAYAVTGVVFLLVSVLLLSINFPSDEKNKNLLFYNNSPGYLQQDVTSFGKYGLQNVGMFGMLPRYARAKGYNTAIVDSINENDLKHAKVLVIMNLTNEFDSKSTKLIWDFIRKGGSLLIMGDHTGDAQIRIPSNKLLKPFHISYNFDSAIPMTDMWTNGLETLPHPILKGINNNEIQINIGASLDVKSPARPVIIGRKGFSDKGDLSNKKNGYLGDMFFTSSERIGDLTLVADARYGKGKVLVFGDTTAFQNTAISVSNRFMDNIFHWLCSDGRIDLYPLNMAASLIALGLAFILFIALFRENLLIITIYTLILAIVPFICSISTQTGYDSNNVLLHEDAALIDLSHLERVSQDKTSSSIDGITANLIRNNYMPFVMERFNASELYKSKLLIIAAPSKPFTKGEAAQIKEFVENGGCLIVTTGWEESAGSMEILKEFGFGLEDIPLGNITPEQNPQGVSFWEAWPVSFKKDARTRVLVKAWNYPLIVRKDYGRGGVLVIGDSSFLQSKNLEYVDSYNERNINFLRSTLNSFKESRSMDENKK